MEKNESFSNHCMQMFMLYSDYLDGELDEDQKIELETHISECPECQSCIISMKKTIEVCSKFPEYRAPDNFSRKLHERIRNIILSDKDNKK